MIDNIIASIIIFLCVINAIVIFNGYRVINTKESLGDKLLISWIFLMLAVIVGVEQWM